MFSTAFGFVPLAASLLGASRFELGLLGVVSTLPGIFMAPIAGSIMPRKFGAATTLVIGFLLAGAGSGLVAFSGSLTVLFIVQVVANVGSAILGTLLLGLCIHDISVERRAAAMGFYQAVYGVGMFTGPFVTGHVSYAFGLDAAFVFIGFVGIFGAICTFIFAKKGHLMY
jgi:MFS family permease